MATFRLQVFFRRWGRLVPVQHYVSWWPAAIGAFRSGYCFRVLWFPRVFANLPCIVGFDVFYLSASTLPVFRLRCPCLCCLGYRFGLSLASFTFLVYQWLFRSINFISFHSSSCPVPLLCSETAEF